MSRLDELPPDQRAALSLLLRQRKRYAEVAAMLDIPESAVRARAHAALAVLAPRRARELTAQRRQEIGDYLLGQEGVAERLATRTFLNGSEPGRAWAQAISAELAPLAEGALPDIPPGPTPTSSAAAIPAGAQTLAQARQAGAGAGAPAPRSSGSLPSSRVGGALLLAAIVAAVVVAVILITNSSSTHAKKTAATSTTAKTTTGPTVTQRIPLRSPDPRSRSIGAMEVVSENGKLAFVIAAEHLPPSHGFYYAIWLYNSPTSALPLSKSPPVGTNERLEGAAALPASAGAYHQVLLTRETSERPTHPGLVILQGPFSLGG
jgi:Sigma-70, region 4